MTKSDIAAGVETLTISNFKAEIQPTLDLIILYYITHTFDKNLKYCLLSYNVYFSSLKIFFLISDKSDKFNLKLSFGLF